ncbi:MAG: hypothetical protein ACXWVS_09915, partial [Hyphomicrobium sp.]
WDPLISDALAQEVEQLLCALQSERGNDDVGVGALLLFLRKRSNRAAHEARFGRVKFVLQGG